MHRVASLACDLNGARLFACEELRRIAGISDFDAKRSEECRVLHHRSCGWLTSGNQVEPLSHIMRSREEDLMADENGFEVLLDSLLRVEGYDQP